MVNLASGIESVWSGTVGTMRSQLNNAMIQNAVFAALTFLIIAHPATFAFVDNIIRVKDKNMLLLFHAFVVGVIMYVGSMYLFGPALNLVLGEGYKNPKKSKKR